eukprot:COSAG01_NODE_8851_length_2637_cov_6.265957_1_plen_131_part_00
MVKPRSIGLSGAKEGAVQLEAGGGLCVLQSGVSTPLTLTTGVQSGRPRPATEDTIVTIASVLILGAGQYRGRAAVPTNPRAVAGQPCMAAGYYTRPAAAAAAPRAGRIGAYRITPCSAPEQDQSRAPIMK